MRKSLAKRPLRQRVIALIAAYAIALSGLLASFGAARTAAAEAAAVPGGIICHTLTADQQAPSPSTDTGKICVDNCCVGCLMLLAALPPPPMKVFGATQSAAQLLAPPAAAVLSAGPHSKSHRSRAPPLSA